MIRTLLPSASFGRIFKRLLKRDPPAAREVNATLKLLEADAFDPRLRTHKLTGIFEGRWACSAGDDLRIMFRFVIDEGSESILLQTVGTHDEVY